MSEQTFAGLRWAATLAKMMSEQQGYTKSYDYPIQAPTIAPGVVPAGKSAPVMAVDYAPYLQEFQNVAATGFPGFTYLAQLTARAEYRAFASAISTELTRKWIEFTSTESDGDTNSDKIKVIDAEFQRLGVQKLIETCAQHDCYFGRAQIFIDIAGADIKTPLIIDPRTIRVGSLERVVPVEAMWTTPATYNALDPSKPDFYRPPKWFMLGQEVHATRLMTVITRPLPDMLKPAFNFAGISLSQLAEPYVDNWLRTRQAVSDLINNFSTTGLKTAMEQILQGGGEQTGSDLIARATLFTQLRSNKGLMLLDKDREELVQLNVPLSGLDHLQAQAQEHMCSVSRIPAIILTGISPSGLNASSDGEIRVFYDWIAAQQEAFWREPLTVILKVVQLSLFGEIDPNINFKFLPLYQMSEAEQATIKLQDAQRDQIYLDAQVLAPEEVRERLASDPDSGYQGLRADLELPAIPEGPGGVEIGDDESVSEKQHRAMEAAAHGHSTLGIPKSVGEEFVSKDAQGS